MQFYNKSNSIKNLLLFAVVLFIAYLPATSFLYFIKNDAFNGYFPPRFFMSESIHAGHLPLWNPYINYGYPQYGDMSGSYWSPVVWLFSLIGYNAYLFTVEIFIYIFLCGVGMYRLSGHFTNDKNVQAFAGIVMLGCGFNSSHLQHVNWLSGLAFGILFVDALLSLIKRPGSRIALQFIFFGYLFISSAHPTLIISFAYFMLAIMIFTLWKNEINSGWTRQTFKWFSLGAIGLVILSAGLVTGYLDIIPYLQRATETGIKTATSDGVPFSAWLSFIFPMSVIKDANLAGTELTMRNMYVGLPVLLIIIHSFFSRKTKWQIFFLVTAFAFLVLAKGGIFKILAYHSLPLMSYVRLNGVFLGISTICLVLTAVVEYKKLQGSEKWQKIILFAMIVSAFVSIAGISAALITRDSILFKEHGLNAKNIIDGITWYDTLWIQGAIQFLICIALRRSAFQSSRIKWIIIADIIIATLLNLPYTGVGRNSVADVHAVLKTSPNGIPVPGNNLIIDNKIKDTISQGLTGHWSMYGKQPGVTRWVPYPITLVSSWNYFESLRAGDSGHLHKPFAFIAGNSESVQVTKFTGSMIELNTADSSGQLVIQQNFFPHWKYRSGKSLKTVERFDDTFISVPLMASGRHVILTFEPTLVKITMLVSLVLFLILTIILLFWSFRENRKGPR